jgi:ankyrin repeat protein
VIESKSEMSSLEELSDQLVEIIKSKDDPLNDVIEFLNVQGEQAREIINTMGKKSKKTPLMEACSQSKESIVKLLLTSGSDPNIISHNNYDLTALIYTIEKNEIKESDLNIVKMLSQYGANLNFRYGGLSPLENASFPLYTHSRVTRKGAYELVELLIQLGADVNTKGNEGKTPLMLTLMGLGKVVPLLIKAGANVDAQDNQGEAALMKFVRGSDQMVNVLLDAKANVFITNLRGLTAVEQHQQHDLHYRWSTPNIDFIPRLTKAYLEPLCSRNQVISRFKMMLESS